MPKFKPKTNKNIEVNANDILTVDRKHEEIIKKLSMEEKKIPKLEKEIKELKERLNGKSKTSNKSANAKTSYEISHRLNIVDIIKDKEYEIERIKEMRKNYYLNNSRYLFNYFESKKEISNEGDEMGIDVKDGKIRSSMANVKSRKKMGSENKIKLNQSLTSKNAMVKSFFKIKDNVETKYGSDNNKEEDENRESLNNKESLNGTGTRTKTKTTLPLIDELNPKYYFSNMDESFIDMQDYVENYDSCEYCNGEMSCIESEGIMVCRRCFRQKEYLVEHDKPSYKEPPKEVSFYAYKRINHFREIIAQFQAKETTNIEDHVIEDIKQQIKKERITIYQLSNEKMKHILKKLGYNKYYEHISFIKEKLGITPPKMSVELETKLCNLFLEIQKPYAKFCPNARVNFLNYYYVLYKLCELLREDSYLPYFYMLKDQVKRMEQDEIWKKICKYLNWEFIPTL